MEIQALTLAGKKFPIKTLSLFILLFSNTAISKEKVAIITGSNDLGEKSLGSEMFCMAKAFSEIYKNKYDISLLNNKRTIEGTLSNIEEIKKNNIKLVIGSANSTESKPLADNSKFYKFYTPLATNPSLLSSKNVFLFNSNDTVIAKKLAAKINQEKEKNVALITNISSNYSKYLSKTLSSNLAKNKKVLSYSFIEGDQNPEKFKKFITKNKINILFFPIHASRAAYFYNALKELKGSYKIYGADGIGGRPRFLKSISPTKSNIRFYYVKSWNGEVFKNSPHLSEFNKIKNKYCPNKKTSMVMAFMFDTLNFVLNDKIDKKNYFGVSGSHSFKNNVSTRKLFLFSILDNKNKLLGEF